MKYTFFAICAGLASGLLVLASLSGASIAVAYLTLVLPLPMFMAGLGMGIQKATIAIFSGLVVTTLGAPVSGLAFVIMFAAPVWVIIRLALTGPNGPIIKMPKQTGPFVDEGPVTSSTVKDRFLGRVADWDGEPGQPARDLNWFSVGHIAAGITALAGGYLVIVSLFAINNGGLESVVTSYLTEMADMIAGNQDQKILKEAIIKAAPFFPGSVAAFWALSLLGNAILAQGLLAKGGHNLRPTPRLRELRLPDWLSWAFVAVALMALIASGEMEYMGRNLALVLAVPFFFLGLAVVHKVAGLTPLPGALLALIYVVMIFSGWFILVIAGLGIMEQWVGLKAHMEPPESGLEN